MAEHHRQTKHNIDWDSAACVTYSTNHKQRLTLGSWFTNLEPEPLNRSQQLSTSYKRLIQNLRQTAKQYTYSTNADDAYPQTPNLPQLPIHMMSWTSYINRLTVPDYSTFSTLKMTTDEAVETSVTNSLSQDYTNVDVLPSPTCTESPGLKSFTFSLNSCFDIAKDDILSGVQLVGSKGQASIKHFGFKKVRKLRTLNNQQQIRRQNLDRWKAIIFQLTCI